MSERVANITAVGIRRRRQLGIVMAVVSIALGIAMLAGGWPRWSRWLLFIPIAIAVNGFLQAHERTCVVLGVMGSRETEEGGYRRMSPAECAVSRRQVRSILVKDVLVAAMLTIAFWFA